LKLGTIGFGGPVALVGYMHRDLVEERKWISESDYKEGLTLAQLMPGPLAAQLAIYLGYVHYGNLGGNARWNSVRHPVIFDGGGDRRRVCRLRRHHLDASGVLRRWRISDRYHRCQRLQAHHQKHRQGQAVVGDLPGQRGSDDPHRIGVGVVISPTVLLAVLTVVLIRKFKKLPEPAIVAAAALVGLVVHPLMKS
jgi:hypothetical protein